MKTIKIIDWVLKINVWKYNRILRGGARGDVHDCDDDDRNDDYVHDDEYQKDQL